MRRPDDHRRFGHVGRTLLAALLAIPVIGASASIHVQAERDKGEWTSVGHDPHEQRFSPLTQLNSKTVGALGLAWYADIDTERGQEATPIVVDGVLYVSTAWSMVKAFNVRSGKLLWAFDPNVARTKAADACCDVVNRGVAAWKGRIFLGALDGRLIALDAHTGKLVWSVQTTDASRPYTITGAPRIVKGKVIIGNGGAEYRTRGYVSAYDAKTGKLAWRWYVVPGDPSKPFEQPELAMAAKTWRGEWWKIGGGGTPWDSMAYDPQLDTLYVGTGNGDPWNQAIRSPGGGDNLFLASVVALDPTTGRYKCHFQETPGETWDYTSTQPIIVAELNYPTGKRKVLLHAPKNGFFYVLDAKTCQPIAVEKFAPQTWASGWDHTANRPIENINARFDKTGKPGIVFPSALGMHNWHPMAFSPLTGLVYIPVQVSNTVYAPDKNFKLNMNGWNTGTDFGSGYELYDRPGAPKPGEIESYILAWDPVRMKEVWRAKNTVYGSSGVLVTAGNLVFSGNHAGQLAAYDAATGKKIWAQSVGARVVAAPAAFNVDGHEQIALLVGARGLPPGQKRTSSQSGNNSRMLVFALGGNAVLPTQAVAADVGSASRIDPPLLTAGNETVAAGEQVFFRTCTICHGAAAVAGEGAIAPDLRFSPFLRQSDEFKHVVLDGQRAQRGMPAFKGVLTAADADAVQAYLIKRANDEKAAQDLHARSH